MINNFPVPLIQEGWPALSEPATPQTEIHTPNVPLNQHNKLKGMTSDNTLISLNWKPCPVLRPHTTLSVCFILSSDILRPGLWRLQCPRKSYLDGMEMKSLISIFWIHWWLCRSGSSLYTLLTEVEWKPVEGLEHQTKVLVAEMAEWDTFCTGSSLLPQSASCTGITVI